MTLSSGYREDFLSAEIGITGCNFAVAETGSVCLVTNEGNARMCTTLPKTHIAVMGMERIAPTFAEETYRSPCWRAVPLVHV